MKTFRVLRLLATALIWCLSIPLASRAATPMLIQLTDDSGDTVPAWVAGPPNATAGIVVFHDYFGITPATMSTVDRYARMGFRVIAPDLYKGVSATTDAQASLLMDRFFARPPAQIDSMLNAGMSYMAGQVGPHLGVIGFSFGGYCGLRAALNRPDPVLATALVYGWNFDGAARGRLGTLRGTLLTVVGARDEALAESTNLFNAMNAARQSVAQTIMQDVDHAYMQPRFLGGANYNRDASCATWHVIDDMMTNKLPRDAAAARSDGASLSCPIAATRGNGGPAPSSHD